MALWGACGNGADLTDLHPARKKGRNRPNVAYRPVYDVMVESPERRIYGTVRTLLARFAIRRLRRASATFFTCSASDPVQRFLCRSNSHARISSLSSFSKPGSLPPLCSSASWYASTPCPPARAIRSGRSLHSLRLFWRKKLDATSRLAATRYSALSLRMEPRTAASDLTASGQGRSAWFLSFIQYLLAPKPPNRPESDLNAPQRTASRKKITGPTVKSNSLFHPMSACEIADSQDCQHTRINTPEKGPSHVILIHSPSCLWGPI